MLANCWCSVLPAPSIICFIQFIPFPAVFLAHLILVPPGHSSSVPTTFPGLFSAVSGVSPQASGILGISPPPPQGCAPALSGPAMTVLQPYLCVSGCHLWEQELQPSALLPSRNSAHSKTRAGCGCSGQGASHSGPPVGASPTGSCGQEEFFWASFFLILVARMGGLQQWDEERVSLQGCSAAIHCSVDSCC